MLWYINNNYQQNAMTNIYSGQCICQNVACEIRLPQRLQTYSARACDCEFCQARGINYLSAPSADITITANSDLQVLQQGSMQASFLACRECNLIIAVTIQTELSYIGALNSEILEAKALLLPPTVASPKLLSADEKLARWQKVWAPIKMQIR